MVLIQDKVQDPLLNGRISSTSRKEEPSQGVEKTEVFDPAIDDNRGHFILENKSVKFKDGDVFDKDFALDTLKQVVKHASKEGFDLFETPSKRNELVIRLCKMFCWPTDLVNTTIDINEETIDDLDDAFGVNMKKSVKANSLTFDNVDSINGIVNEASEESPIEIQEDF